LLMKDFLPEDVSDLSMQLCSFPNLSIAGLELSDIAAEACDFKRLTVTDCRINQCKFRELECEELHLEGTVIFSGTTLDFECPVTIGLGAHVELNHCSVSDSLRHQLEASVVRHADRRLLRERRARFTFSRMSAARAVQM